MAAFIGAERSVSAEHAMPTEVDDRGASADRPTAFTLAAWRDVLARVWTNSGRQNISLMAAGVAFFAFLSFVPLLGALVMGYGLFADPGTVAQHMRMIIDLVPADAARLIYEQLVNLTTSATSKKGVAMLIALAVSVYGASRASGALMSALNVIYEEEDKRGIIRWTIVSALLIVGAILIGIVGLFAASMLGYVQDIIGGVGSLAATLIRIASWLAAGVLCSAAIAAMYRYAPDRADARWRWLSLGSILATLLWLAATLAFGVYTARFGDYDATYGSLGAVVVLLMWLYVSAYAILLGGFINAEAERQTARDSTTGPEQPMGERGAVVADTSAAAHSPPDSRS